MNLNDIKDAIQHNRVKITDHADEESQNDNISFEEIYFSVIHGEIIKNYPSDKPYPSCLVYGKTFNGDPIHSVWAFNISSNWAVLITVYRPDPNLWINWKERRK